MEDSRCLEPVIRFLKANTRFQLSQRCPSIRILEKSTVLHIEKLEFNPTRVVIDEALIYELEVLEDHLHPRRYDLDEYCCVDMDICVEQNADEILIDNRSIKREREEIKFENSEIWREQQRVANLVNDEDRVKATAALDRRIMIHQMKMLRVISRVTKIPPLILSQEPINHHMKFSIHNSHKHGNYVRKTGTIHEELLTYDKKLHDAQFYVLQKLLGGRSRINVKTLHVWSEGLLRVPAHLNLKVHHLQCYSLELNKSLNSISPLLEPSSLPLKSLWTCYVPDIVHPIMESAGELTISNGDGIIKLTNLKVKVLIYFLESMKEPEKLIEKWITDAKQIGTEFRLSIPEEIKTKMMFDHIKRRFKERIVGMEESNETPISVTLAMNNAAELLITRKTGHNFRTVTLKVLSRSEKE